MNDQAKGTADSHPQPDKSIDLARESVAGEEDPGASLDMPDSSPAASAGRTRPFASAAAINPGDEAPAGTPGTGETLCRACGGSGQLAGSACEMCGGTGKVTAGLGGG
jgi:hypothetical protein